MFLGALRPLMLLSAMRLILERFFIPAKRALRPRTLFRALRPGTIFAGIASADAFRRLASNQLASLPEVSSTVLLNRSGECDRISVR
jgi:hypothetical protein